MNGYLWHIQFVDPHSSKLVDRTDTLRVATTDPRTNDVYLSSDLYGYFLVRVLVHELGHCALFSYHLLGAIHRMVRPEYWIEAEEWICNFVADYGLMIFDNAFRFLGYHAWVFIPDEIDYMIRNKERRTWRGK